MPQSKRVGDISVSWTDRLLYYTGLAKQLRARAALRMIPITATGLSWEEKRTNDADPDRVAPAAKTDGMNYPPRLDRDATTGT